MKLRRWTVFESAFINKWQAEAEVLEICHLRAFMTCLYPCKLGIGLGLRNLLTHSKHPAGLTSSRIAHQDSAWVGFHWGYTVGLDKCVLRHWARCMQGRRSVWTSSSRRRETCCVFQDSALFSFSVCCVARQRALFTTSSTTVNDAHGFSWRIQHRTSSQALLAALAPQTLGVSVEKQAKDCWCNLSSWFRQCCHPLARIVLRTWILTLAPLGLDRTW